MIKLKLLISENVQLATRLYGSALEESDIEWLNRVTDGRKDYTYKTLVELMLEEKQGYGKWNLNQWKDAYTQLLNYHRNIFPIDGFSFDSPKPTVSKRILSDRAEVIKIISKWPKIAKRNLRADIAEPRRSFDRLRDRVQLINHYLTFLFNKPEQQQATIFKKVFSSDHPTFDEVLDYVEEKHNLLSGGEAFNKDGLYKIVEDHKYDLRIVYDKGNIVVVDVTGQPGVKAIGCNSLWCFSYGSEYGKAGEQFDSYSHNGHVYAVVNFEEPQDSPDFIHIVIKPFENQTHHDDPGIFNMANEEGYGNAKQLIWHFANKDDSIFDVFRWDVDGQDQLKL